MKKILQNMFDKIETDMKSECKITGMPSGYLFDFCTRGFFPGKLYIFAGPPRSLKTSLLLNISFFMGCDFHYFVKYCSLCETPELLTRRMLFAACNIPITKYPYESLKNQAMQRLYAAGEKLKNSNLKIICDSLLSIEAIEEECSNNKWKGVVVIDSFQLFVYNKQKSSILKKLKDIAVRWNVAILVAYDTNYNSIVNEHFLIKNGVDSIFLLRREKDFGLDEGSGTLFFSILKQKDGSSADFILNYNKSSFKIYDDENDIFDSLNLFANERIPVC